MSVWREQQRAGNKEDIIEKVEMDRRTKDNRYEIEGVERENLIPAVHGLGA